nr:TetR/AcrR family transcriptional regulator [Frigidibacter sp. ROC022]
MLDTRVKKDAEATRAAILTAATYEFSEYGVSGARIDRIAARAQANKSLIYSYFGDKEALYAIVLRSAYAQIRAGERELDLSSLEPVEAIRELVRFTYEHYIKSPWFLRLLAGENLRRGETVRGIEDIRDLQSPLKQVVEGILEEGRAQGLFRDDVGPTELYLLIASLFYFPLSNKYTIEVVFEVDTQSEAWSKALLKRSQDLVIAFLRPPDSQEG